MFSKRGVSLIACIWICTLVVWLGINSAILFRYKFADSASAVLKTRSFYAALGGIMEALARMGNQQASPDSNGENQWMPDEKVHKIEYTRCKVYLILESEESKLNINKLPPDQLQKAFEKIGLPGELAAVLSDRVADFIDADDIPKSNGAEKDEYEQMGLTHLPSNSPLTNIEELLLVPGIDWNLFWKGPKPGKRFALLPGRNSLFEFFSVYGKRTTVLQSDNEDEIRNWKNGELYRIVSAASCGDYGKVVLYCIVKLQLGQIPHYKIARIKEII